MKAADALRHVNEHVLQDIEDFILMKGFKKKTEKQVNEAIMSDLHERRMFDKIKILKEKKEEKEEEEID